MYVVDQATVRAAPDQTFPIAAQVERWPEFLPHYRWVRVLERSADRAVVEMAAWRPFGLIRYPVWWVSEMFVDQAKRRITYRHIRGITSGMAVEWRVDATADGSVVRIVHEWPGPEWPLIGGLAASLIIGPVFIHGIASRTLAGVKARAEAA